VPFDLPFLFLHEESSRAMQTSATQDFVSISTDEENKNEIHITKWRKCCIPAAVC